MSASLPASITITQSGIGPRVTIENGDINAPALGLPPYPLSSNPGETWWLTTQNGVLTWVQQPDAPSNAIMTLEDAQGFIGLEDGEGNVILEI